MAAPPPPLVALPEQPNDLQVPLPAALDFPPTANNVHEALMYCHNVDLSILEQPPDVRCNLNDCYNAVLYEHNIVAQAAAAAAGPGQVVAPPWAHQLCLNLQNDIRGMMVPDVKQLVNQHQGDGTIVQFDMVPFPNGSDPTLPLNNLLPLHSVDDIDNLNGQDLRDYLIGYGVVPLQVSANGIATNHLWKV